VILDPHSSIYLQYQYSAFTLETVLKTYFCRLSRLGSSLFSGYPNRVTRYFAVAPTYLSTPTHPMGVWDVPLASDEQYHGCYVTVHVSFEEGGSNVSKTKSLHRTIDLIELIIPMIDFLFFF
jgi:hypothetical protein